MRHDTISMAESDVMTPTQKLSILGQLPRKLKCAFMSKEAGTKQSKDM